MEKDVFKSSDVQVIGVSGDSVEKQKQFKEKQSLTVSCDRIHIPRLGVLTLFFTSTLFSAIPREKPARRIMWAKVCSD